MAITLGKDATLTVGSAITSVRNVQWNGSSRTIDVEEFGVRANAVYSIGYTAAVSFEINDDSDVDLNLLVNGTVVQVSGGAAGWSFYAIVDDVSEINSLDGVTTFQVSCLQSRQGLRA